MRTVMIIRDAKLSDAPVMQQLLLQLGSNYQRSVEEIENRIQTYHLQSRQRLLVAELEGKVVGLIAFGCYEQFRLQGCCCHIDTLVVDATCRGKGVGKALVEIAEQYAKEQGATEIELTTANSRRAHGTHDFYKTIGYMDHLEIDCTYFVKQKSM